MLSKTLTAAIIGLEGQIVEVETDIAQGMPAFNIVGLPDAAVQESRERVRSAIRNSGVEFPRKRITVSLAPSDLRKSGPAYDLPIAVGVLASAERVPLKSLEDALFLGEISLDGSLRHTHGILPMIAVGKHMGLKSAFVPASDAEEASLVRGIKVYAIRNLVEIVNHLTGQKSLEPFPPSDPKERISLKRNFPDLRDVRGQEHAKRALQVAAAGAHNVLMSGPPGSGKTLLARCLPSIMPPMSFDEAIEVTSIYSVAGLLPKSEPLVYQRPFRSPHYTVSNAGLVGGGAVPRPGDATLSHRGVLFLDELPEFGQSALDSLRQPIEDKLITISRARGTVTFPANFMLVGAMNPCPCGFYNDPAKPCSCPPASVVRYRRRISGPLMDRMDIFINVPRVEYKKLTSPPVESSSEKIRKSILNAHSRQVERLGNGSAVFNSDMGPTEVWELCKVENNARPLIEQALDRFNLSARGFHRILKVARTIADLADEDLISVSSLAESIQYRPKDSR